MGVYDTSHVLITGSSSNVLLEPYVESDRQILEALAMAPLISASLITWCGGLELEGSFQVTY